MTKYFLTIVEPEWDPTQFSSDDFDEAWKLHNAFSAAIRDAGGTVLGGEALQPAKVGYRIDARLKDPAVGSLDDTTDVVTGFYLVELPDDADPVPIFALCPSDGHVDVRLVADLPDNPGS